MVGFDEVLKAAGALDQVKGMRCTRAMSSPDGSRLYIKEVELKFRF